jgi:hypothetical protein
MHLRRAGYRSAVEQSSIIDGDGMRYMMSPLQRPHFLLQHLEGNESLFARYHLDAPGWFFLTLSADAEWVPPRPIEPHEYTGIMLEALNRLIRWDSS